MAHQNESANADQGRGKVETLSGAVRKTVWSGESGYVALYICDLWRGVSVWFNEVRLKKLPVGQHEDHCIKINYCLNGRCELKLENEGYFYQFENQLTLSSTKTQEFYSYPTGIYDGIEVFLQLDDMEPSFKEILEGLGFSCSERETSLFGVPSTGMRELLGELAELLRSGQASVSRYRIDTLRLLFMISAEGVTPMARQCFLTLGQREIAQRIEKDLTADLTAHITVEQLAAKYKVSPSSLKKYFTMLYGANITSYMQRYRCEKAAELLAKTDLKVGEIAALAGYTHQGKFGEVFRKVMGCTPTEYRRRSIGIGV